MACSGTAGGSEPNLDDTAGGGLSREITNSHI